MTCAGFHAGVRRPAGFSLVEVLVAVLVLALGLLGLGAVFPTVLRQQRIATETTLGISAQNAALPILSSNENFKDGGRGWQALREWVKVNQPVPGGWTPIEPLDSDFTLLGAYELPHPDGTFVYLPLSQRLYPLPYSSEAEPRFVWDFAARFVDWMKPDESGLVVAMFLRPIDPGIKPAFSRGGVRHALTEVLLDPNVGNQDRRLAVSIDLRGNPTFDGTRARGAHYAVPVVARVTGSGVGSPLDQCVIDQSNVYSQWTDPEVADRLFGQIGQRFIDRRGVVYTVIQAERPSNASIVTVTPPFPDVDGDGTFSSADQDAVNPVIFLPQVTAVEPHVFTITP